LVRRDPSDPRRLMLLEALRALGGQSMA
jgi:hypothetical protein